QEHERSEKKHDLETHDASPWLATPELNPAAAPPFPSERAMNGPPSFGACDRNRGNARGRDAFQSKGGMHHEANRTIDRSRDAAASIRRAGRARHGHHKCE